MSHTKQARATHVATSVPTLKTRDPVPPQPRKPWPWDPRTSSLGLRGGGLGEVDNRRCTYYNMVALHASCADPLKWLEA
jgi:hypothetical protein